MNNEGIVENLKFTFTPELNIIESKEEGESKIWLHLGGVALVEGTSRNKNHYTFENLKENDNRSFKWLVGHPSESEQHVVGLGTLKLVENKLVHEGKIRNTKSHPDVVDQVKDGFLGPSIHASAKKVSFKEGKYFVEGLEIEGVGLVAFQGVRDASIEYALAESYDKKMIELETENVSIDNKKVEVTLMEEEKVNTQLSKLEEQILALTQKVEELTKVKESEKEESEEEEVEESSAIVENEDEPEVEKEFEESADGVTLSKSMYEKFNKELKERI